MKPFTPKIDRAFDAAVSISYTLAIITTCLRLYRRRTVGKIWWDDRFAFFSMLGGVWLFVLFWMKAVPPDSVTATRSHRKARFWMGMVLSWTTIWCTRISLALGTSRIFPPQHFAHRCGVISACVFACFLFSLLIAVVVQCVPDSAWYPPKGVPATRVMCFIPMSSIYYSVVAGLLSDTLLIAVPVSGLRNLRAPRTFRYMLLASFAASIVITLTAIVIVVFQLLPDSWEPMKSETRIRINYLEAGVSIIVCNLIVVVSYAFRLVHGPSIGTSADSGTTTPETHSLSSKPSRRSFQQTTATGTSITNSQLGLSFTEISSSGYITGDAASRRSFDLMSYDPDTMESTSRYY